MHSQCNIAMQWPDHPAHDPALQHHVTAPNPRAPADELTLQADSGMPRQLSSTCLTVGSRRWPCLPAPHQTGLCLDCRA